MLSPAIAIILPCGLAYHCGSRWCLLNRRTGANIMVESEVTALYPPIAIT